MAKTKGSGTKDKPWALQTPPGTSEITAYRDESLDPPDSHSATATDSAVPASGSTAE